MLQSATAAAATLSATASFMPASAASFGTTVAAAVAAASYTATALIFLRARRALPSRWRPWLAPERFV